MSVPWKEGRQLVSNEEISLRWDVMQGKVKLSDTEFEKRIKEIRKRTKKP